MLWCFIVAPTKSKISYISDFLYSGYALQMMNLNLCGKLKRLSLDFYDRTDNYRLSDMNIYDIFRSSRGDCPRILHQIKSTPVLTALSLYSPLLSIVDREILYENVPTLEMLELHRPIMWSS
ncbi:hypothetical protein K501DRAFT_274106 [Backusella circina FSU 941]|nr:hypothetical protein K501DRAFT_274106 [Backusella circina FSU 941]